MERQLEKETMKKIFTNNIENKEVIRKQIVLLESFISSKATTISSKLDRESFEEISRSLLGESIDIKLI